MRVEERCAERARLGVAPARYPPPAACLVGEGKGEAGREHLALPFRSGLPHCPKAASRGCLVGATESGRRESYDGLVRFRARVRARARARARAKGLGLG